MQKTLNYNLNKPDLSERVDVAHLNQNADIIDSTLKQIDNKSVSLSKLAIERALGFTINTNVPSGAKFTQTTINGKTGIITKADILALGISEGGSTGGVSQAYVDSRVKTPVPLNANFDPHPTSHLASMITENTSKRFVTDVEKSTWNGKQDKLIAGANIFLVGNTISSTGGSGTIDTSSLLPRSGGILEDYVEKLTTTTGAINLNLGNVFYINATANTTFSISNAKAGLHSFTLIVQMGAVRTLNFPSSVKWQDGTLPDMTSPNRDYILTFASRDRGTTWLGMFGGEF